MTACVNKQRGAAVKAAVGVTLGALSLGVVPAVAVAEDISLQAATEGEAYLNGTVATYKVGADERTGNGPVTIKKSDLADSEIVITSVTPEGVGAEPVEKTHASNTYYYKKASKSGTAIKINGQYWEYVGAAGEGKFASLAAGEYIAATNYNNESFTAGKDNVAPTVAFTVVADTLDGAKLVKDLGNGEYTDELTYEYGQEWKDLKVVLDGEVINDVNVSVYAKGTDDDAVTGTINAGTYKVVIKGTGDYEGGEVQQEVTVSKLDLSTLDLYVQDVTDGRRPVLSDVMGTGLEKLTDAKLSDDNYNFEIQGNTWGSDGAGEYTYELSVKANTAEAKNVEGTATLKFNRVNPGAATATWYYEGTHLLSQGGRIIIDRSAAADDTTSSTWTFKDFDLSKIGGVFNDTDGNKVDLAEGEYTVTVKDADGKVVDSMAKKGTYTIVIEAVPSKFDYDVQRSTVSFTAEVKQGKIGKADTVFTYDGKVVTSLAETYDGEDFLSRLGILVKSGDKTLTAGTDYTVTAKDDKGNKVDKIVDAGKYTVTVSSDLYEINGTLDGVEEFKVIVKPIELTKISFDRTAAPFKTLYAFDEDGNPEPTTYIPYTGSAIENPTVVYTVKDDNGKDVEVVLPESVYTIEWTFREDGKTADALAQTGQYNAVVKLNEDTVNYTDASGTGLGEAVRVLKDVDTGFEDVADEEWYAEPVNKAKLNGYVNGYSDTNFYGPNRTIKRGDVVCILYNMAGGDGIFEGYENSFGGYNTGFSDVDSQMYYAKAIQWAENAGIVNGYSDGTFAPEKSITREEFASMLANYASQKGENVVVEDADAALESFGDASQVSDWAKSNVAWAVENGVMGNGGFLNATGDITRAETAAMAVNYQPGIFAEE